MRTLFNSTDCAGKTLESIKFYNEWMALNFTDGSSCVVYAQKDWEDLAINDIEINSIKDNQLDFHYDMSVLGVCTTEEYNEIKSREENRRKESLKQARRLQYEELKKEFDNENDN